MPAKFPFTTVVSLALLATAPTQAADECPFLSSEAVANAFSDSCIWVDSAEAAGGCSWQFTGGGMVRLQIYKQESAKSAKARFSEFKKGTAQEAPRGAHAPAIGQQAFFGMTPKGAQHATATLLTLQDDRVLMMTYVPTEQGKDVEDKVTAPMLALGRKVNTTGARVDQSYGKCSWFTEAEAIKLLGKGKLTIHRHGPDMCMASTDGTRATLHITVKPNKRNPNEGRAEPGTGFCPGVLLPQFGEDGVAEYKCPAPMNHTMRISFHKNDVDVELNYIPAGRDPNDADVQALLPIVKRTYDAL